MTRSTRRVPIGSVVRSYLALLLAAALVSELRAETALTAAQLAESLAAAVEDGDATARARFKSASGEVLQVQIKSRRGPGRSAVAYEVLWPAERKGETVILRRSGGGAPEGWIKSPSCEPKRIEPAQFMDGIFGSELAVRDTLENFFRWGNQTLAGQERIGNADCVILESRPASKDSTSYGKVRSWIDTRRMIALRVEKFDRSGRLVRRIETTQVAKDDRGRHVPAGMEVTQAGRPGMTEISGSNIRHDVRHEDSVFSP